MPIHSDPNNMNSIVYHLTIERYSMNTLHWYFPWATALDLYNMTVRGEKLQQLHCYHPFSDSLDIYLTKNHYENYSPKMVPIAKIWGSGSWTKGCFAGTGAIVRLPQCQWSKPDGYGKISQCITTTKHSKAKTVSIFLGIYYIRYECDSKYIRDDITRAEMSLMDKSRNRTSSPGQQRGTNIWWFLFFLILEVTVYIKYLNIF